MFFFSLYIFTFPAVLRWICIVLGCRLTDTSLYLQAVASSQTHLFKSLSTKWSFRDMAPPPQSITDDVMKPDQTLVTFDLTYAFASPFYVAFSRAFFAQVAEQMVNAFEGRCVSLYGTRQ